MLLRFGLLLGLLFTYYATRAPFLTQPLLGEEGQHADLLSQSTPGPRYALLGRVHGHDVRDIYQHPSMMYALYIRVGAGLRAFAKPDFKATDVWARLVHSLFQLLLLSFLTWRAARAKGMAWATLAGLALVALTSPLGLANSIHLQTDTSSGLLFAGLLGLALADEDAHKPWLAALACVALSMIGKQEWFIGATAGIIGGQLLAILVWGISRSDLKRTGLYLGALVMGQAFSWAFDPLNYMGGWRVLVRLGGHNVAGAGQQELWSQLAVFRIIFLSGLVLCLVISSVLALLAHPDRRRAELRAGMVAWALFVPFALSTWNPSPRYFAPAWGCVLAVLTVQMATRQWRRLPALVVLVAAMALSAWQWNVLKQFQATYASVTEFLFYDYRQVVAQEAAIIGQIKGGCVPRLTAAAAWNKPIDFIGVALALEDGDKILAEYGAKACSWPKGSP